jgi:hypothetical protein
MPSLSDSPASLPAHTNYSTERRFFCRPPFCEIHFSAVAKSALLNRN